MQKDLHRYDNLIDNQRPLARKPMDSAKRAAQFAPFAALTGYEDQISESARITDAEIFLDENEREIIDYNLQYLQEHLQEQPVVGITYFVPDSVSHRGSFKAGGEYVTKQGIVKKIDMYERSIIFYDGDKISIDAVTAVNIGDNNVFI